MTAINTMAIRRLAQQPTAESKAPHPTKKLKGEPPGGFKGATKGGLPAQLQAVFCKEVVEVIGALFSL